MLLNIRPVLPNLILFDERTPTRVSFVISMNIQKGPAFNRIYNFLLTANGNAGHPKLRPNRPHDRMVDGSA